MAPKKPSNKKGDQQQSKAQPNNAPGVTDYTGIQQGEYDALESIYGDDFDKIENKGPWGAISNHLAFRLRLKAYSNADINVQFTIKFTATYPNSVPIIALENTNGLRGQTLKQIKSILDSYPKENPGREIIFDIASAIDGKLQEEAEYREQDDARPGLNEERAETEAIASKLAQDEQLHKIKTQELEKLEEDRALHALVSQEVHRREEGAKRKFKSESGEPSHTRYPDVEAIDFDRTITYSHERSTYSFRSVSATMSRIAQGPVTGVFSTLPLLLPQTGGSVVPTLVVKQCVLPEAEKTKIQELEKELEALRKLGGAESVLSFLDFRGASGAAGWELTILLEYANRGSLAEELESGPLPGGKVRSWSVSILNALEYYHRQGIPHGRVRPSNILLTRNGGSLAIKLGDALYQNTIYKILNKPITRPAWSVNWKAPEHSQPHQNKLALKTDIWDFGVVLLQMLFGLDIPEQQQSPFDIEDNITNLSGALQQMIEVCFARSPHKRPTALKLLAMDFLRGDCSAYEDNPNIASEPLDLILSPLNPRRQSRNQPPPQQFTSRYNTDFMELERLGKGGFGTVYKAQHKLDFGIYAIKKMKQPMSQLKDVLSESIMLSRIVHPHVVRYINTWLEPMGDDEVITDDSDEEFDRPANFDSKFISRVSQMNQGLNLVTPSYADDFDGSSDSGDEDVGFEFGYDDDEEPDNANDGESESEAGGLLSPVANHRRRKSTMEEKPDRRGVLYIQMEYCEQNSLRDTLEDKRLYENIDDIWRLFRKILSGLAYIHATGLVHRDLKPENIFIDKANNPKIGDFGLATSGIHDPALKHASHAAETKGSQAAGTLYYVPPEASKNDISTKYDMYALGIILFEMCTRFETSSEKLLVLKGIKSDPIVFPPALLVPEMAKQRELIVELLSSNPHKRPSAQELLDSGKIPWHADDAKDEKTEELVQWLGDRESNVFKASLNAMFGNMSRHQVESETWEATGSKFRLKSDLREVILRFELVEKLQKVLRGHGAVGIDRATVYPRTTLNDEKDLFPIMGSDGTQLQLVYDTTLSLARYITREPLPADKIFSFAKMFRDPTPGGAPLHSKVLAYDIVSKTALDVALKEAEVIKVMTQVMDQADTFLSVPLQSYIYINHWDLLDIILDHCRVEKSEKPLVRQYLSHGDYRTGNWSSVRSDLRALGIASTIIEDLKRFFWREPPEKAFKQLRKLMLKSEYEERQEAVIKSIQAVLNYAKAFIKKKIYITPLSSMNPAYYESGLMFQLVVDGKKSMVIGAGGRYDRLLRSQKPSGKGTEFNTARKHAVGMELTVDRLTRILVQQIKPVATTSVKKARNVGPQRTLRRCDILVASFDPAVLRSATAGLRVLDHLWDAGFSAELAPDASSLDDLVHQIIEEKHSWIILVKDDTIFSQSILKMVCMPSMRDVDVAFESLSAVLRGEIAEREELETSNQKPTSGHDKLARAPHRTVPQTAQLDPQEKKPNIHFITFQHKGKKTNRATAVEAAQIRLRDMLAQWSSDAPILAVETSDDVLDEVSGLKVGDNEGWKRAIQRAPAGERSYLGQIQEQLLEWRDAYGRRKKQGDESAVRVAFLFGYRSGWLGLVDLGV
jgi:translation initiation factor 2-alpha kinase 4